MQIRARFPIERVQEILEDSYPRPCQFPRRVEFEQPGEFRQILSRHPDGSGERRIPGIPPDFAHLAHDPDGSQLFEDVRVAHDYTLDTGRPGAGLVGADHFDHGRNLLLGETGLRENAGSPRVRVRHVVPTREGVGILWAVAGENSKVVQPDGRVDDVAVLVSGAYLPCQRVVRVR